MRPYYQSGDVTLFCGDCREILPRLEPESADLLLTDPPYPNNAGHFDEDVATAREVLGSWRQGRVITFWHQLETPPVPMPLVARHVWHRTNTNRQDNYEAIYEFAEEQERASRVFAFPVIYPGLTGCWEAVGHPTQKSLRLMEALLLLRGARSACDPFAGVGTTLVAAKRLGVRAIGIEKNEKWAELAARRLASEPTPLFIPEPTPIPPPPTFDFEECTP